MMQVCEVVFGRERGAEVQAFLELATGHPCPCRRGQPCPLMPADSAVAPPPPRTKAVALSGYGLPATGDGSLAI